jgi:hypothetical protein
MTTALDVITGALTDMHVLAIGETPADSDAEYCLSKLNDMMDSWSNEALACFANTEQSGALSANVSAYTIGAGGTFNKTRPLRIGAAPGTAYVQDANGNNYPLAVVTQDQWNLLPNRTTSTNGNLPDTLFYDPQFPLGILNFFPTPNASITAFWDSFLQLSEFAALATAVSLPPGYKPAIQSNLILEIWAAYKPAGATPEASLMRAAALHKGNVKRTNIKPVIAGYDGEIVARGSSTFNVYTGR